MKNKINKDWFYLLENEFTKPYWLSLQKFLVEQRKHRVIYPPENQIYKALELTSFADTKIVILGQDPYHGKNQANGLAFSINKSEKKPPSLVNIHKELKSDLKLEIPNHGSLLAWARNGVLLLNTVLTVENNKAGSHKLKGWELFTDKIIKTINSKQSRVVFILWGKEAQKKKNFITNENHRIIESVHPSPLSAYRGFIGSKPFSKANKYLEEAKLETVNWELT